MKNPGTKILNSILALGMLFIFLGVLLTLAFLGSSPDFATWSIPVVIFLAGLVDLYIYIAFSRSSFKLFLGLGLTFFGIFSLLLACKLFPSGLESLWPVYALLTGLALAIAGRTTGKRFTLNYDFPALVLLGLGIVFLLFSFDVIKIPLRSLAVFIYPGILILAGAFLVILFFHRKALLDILPEEVSKELNTEPNFSDNEEDLV